MIYLGSLTYAVLSTLVLLARDTDKLNQPERVDAPIKKIYPISAPLKNQASQLVAEVEFPSSCYEIGPSRIDVKPDHHVILFHLQAYKLSKACSNGPVTLTKVMDLGILPEGEYELRDYKKLRKWGDLKVDPIRSTKVVEAGFAPVQEITVHRDVLGFKRLVSISGVFADTCARLDAENTTITASANGIIEIEPRIFTKKRRDCAKRSTPFFKTFEIPPRIPSGRYLFHVASLSGNSLSKMEVIENDLPKRSGYLLSHSEASKLD